MQFEILEKSFIEHATFDEGATWSPKESLINSDGNPVMRISDNLKPVDDEAKAYKAAADVFFDKVEADRKTAELAAQGKSDSTEVLLKQLIEQMAARGKTDANAQLTEAVQQIAALSTAFQNVKFTAAKVTPAADAPAGAPAAIA